MHVLMPKYILRVRIYYATALGNPSVILPARSERTGCGIA